MAVIGLLLLIVLAAFSECGEGKKLHVYASGPQTNWFKAFELCRRRRQNLVSVMNEDELVQLKKARDHCSTKCGKDIAHVWTAGSDLHKNRDFVWMTNGQSVTTWNDKYRPDNRGGDEHCVEAYNMPWETALVLNDCPCRAFEQYAVCESQ